MVRLAGPLSLPISAILPFLIPTSPRNAGIPEPSTIRPFLINRSYAIAAPFLVQVTVHRLLEPSVAPAQPAHPCEMWRMGGPRHTITHADRSQLSCSSSTMKPAIIDRPLDQKAGSAASRPN